MSGQCFTWNNDGLCQHWGLYPQHHGKFLLRIRGVKLQAEWSVCTFLARSRNCIMLSVAWHWKSNLYGYQKNLYWSVISINVHYQMHLPMITRTAQVIWEASISDVDQLIGWVLVDWNNSLFEIGIYYPLCVMCLAAIWSILGDQQLLIVITCFNDTICGCSRTPVDCTVKVPFGLILFIVKHPAKTMHIWLSFRKWFTCIILHQRTF